MRHSDFYAIKCEHWLWKQENEFSCDILKIYIYFIKATLQIFEAFHKV